MRATTLIRFTACMLLLICGSKSFSQSVTAKWAGTYYAEAKNKDHLKTSFNLIIGVNGITLKYASDGESEVTYKNVKAVAESPTKLKLTFDPKTGTMGILYLEKSDDSYYFSGEPVYYINPGTEELQAKKKAGK